jgi:phage gp45-like
MSDDLARIRQRLDALESGARLTVTRGQVGAVRFADNRALLQVNTLRGEVLDGVELLGPFGVSAHPRTDSEVIALTVLGERDLVVALAGDALAAGVPALGYGEVGIGDGSAWFSVQADGLHIHAGGRNVIIDAAADVTLTASGTVTVNAALAITGGVAVVGAVNVTGSMTLNGRDVATV